MPARHLDDSQEIDALRSPFQESEEQTPDSPDVMIDSHILSTPVIADIDGDGKDELVVVASYYFDDAIALDMTRLSQFAPDIKLRNYVASGVVVFDLETLHVKWKTPFELTTEASPHKGYAYAPPTVVSLDNDGMMDIIVPTAVGSIHILDHHGVPRPTTATKPMSMDAIYGAVVAEDVNGDGKLELIAVDVGANVACFNIAGDEIWENRIAGVSHSNPVLGDVDGDGELDVVIATDAGFIYALDALSGRIASGFPVKVGGPILASPVLIPPKEGSGTAGLGIGVSCVDGNAYIIHAPHPLSKNVKAATDLFGPGAKQFYPESCVEKIDVGEGSHSSLLIDDFSNDERMNILVATSAGHLYAFNSDMMVGHYGHLASWTSPMHGRNVYKALVTEGIKFSDDTRKRVQITGSTFEVSVDLVWASPSTVRSIFKNQYWKLKFMFGRQKLGEMTAYGAGRFSIRLNAPEIRWKTSLTVEAVNVQGQAFFDRIHVEFNTNFGETLGWIVLVPFIVATSLLLLVKDVKSLLPPLGL